MNPILNNRKFKNDFNKDALENKEVPTVQLKSEMYNHDNEKITRREEESKQDAIMWGFVLGFILFFIILIFIIIFTN